MIRYLLRTLRAQIRRAPSLYLLTLAGVALGVAAVLTIQILNRNALAAFAGSVQAVSGDADLTVLGRTPTFPDSLYVAVLGTPGVAAAWTIYRTDLAVADREAFFLDAVGVDLFAPVAVPFVGEAPDAPEVALADALALPGWVAISPELAEVLGLAIGDTLAVTTGSRRLTLTVGALVDFRRVTPLAGTRLVVLDLSQVQHLLDADGRITQIDLRAVPGTDIAALAERLATR
ncbi:MAG: ABC transporter permease, partial [Gemmatimonadota bacterium]|nr:ABC transporter permease [Gemmatimonadota bacterium]